MVATMTRALWRYVLRIRKSVIEGEEHVFVSQKGRPLSPGSVWNMVYTIALRAHVEGVRASPHTLRHSFAMQSLQNGADVASTSRLLGHTRLQTAENYLKGFQSHEARQLHKKFSPVEASKLGKKGREKMK